MKIHSKFSDYYDSALGSFLESEVVFNRKPEILTFRPQDLPSLGKDFSSRISSPKHYLASNPDSIFSGTYGCDMYTIWVGFCGKYYPLVTMEYAVRELVWSGYTSECLERPLDYYGLFYRDGENLAVEHSDFKTVRVCSDYLADIYASMGVTYAKQNHDFKNPQETEFWKDEAFEKFGPIFIMTYPVITSYVRKNDIRRIFIFRNVRLKTLGFQKAVDPFSALYAINEWLDSHARPDDAVVPVGDDLTRLKSHGFDPKTSFRKGKEGK